MNKKIIHHLCPLTQIDFVYESIGIPKDFIFFFLILILFYCILFLNGKVQRLNIPALHIEQNSKNFSFDCGYFVESFSI